MCPTRPLVVFSRFLLLAAFFGLGVQPLFAQIDVGTAPDGPAWQPLATALADAAESERLILLDVFAPWCTYCHKMQHEVYTDPALKAYLTAHFELGRLDLSVADDAIRYQGQTHSSAALAAELGVWATPTTVFLEPDGTFIIRVSGYQPGDEFAQVLRFMATGAFREQTYEAFLEAGGGR